jgi:hypothetical protein
VNTSNIISTFAGTPGRCGFAGDGGPATSAKLYFPYGLAVDSHNNVYISDYSNQRIRKVSSGTITTFAGNGTAGFLGDGDPATLAELNYPVGITLDGKGNLYTADQNNCVIRQVSATTGNIQTVAGIPKLCGFSGDGAAIDHELHHPQGVLSDAAGDLFVADTDNHLLRWIDTSGNMTTFAASGNAGLLGDGGPATDADLYYPSAVARDAAGNILVVDQYNFRVRKVSAFAGLDISSSSMSFGQVTVNTSSAPQVITVSALGPLTIGSITVSGAFGEADNCGASLPNGTSCNVYVYFKPTTTGLQTGTLTILDNGFFNSMATVSLQGTGTAISVTGGPLAFGSQAVKTTSAAKTVTVTNKLLITHKFGGDTPGTLET